MNTCFICGKFATTREHIIPKWIQRKYKLWDQLIGLPNDTSIPYRKLTIPICNNCNNKVLSPIESKIKNGIASDKEIWKWACKIHYGLTRKDDFLEWDLKNPGYKIGDVYYEDDKLELDRHLVHSITDSFITEPCPFGSVFEFEFDHQNEFYFAHLINIPGICINTGNKGYVVFIKDTGTLKRQPGIMKYYENMKSNSHVGKMLNFFANAWMHLHRFPCKFPIIMSTNFIGIVGSPKLIEEKPFSQSLFGSLWTYLNGGNITPIVTNEEYIRTNGIMYKEGD